MAIDGDGRTPVARGSDGEGLHPVELYVLGPIAARGPAGGIQFTRAKERAVLAALALFHGRAVSTDRLVDAVWGDRLPARAEKALQNHVQRLRVALGSGVVETRSDGYALAFSVVVDAELFETAVAAGEASHGLRNALARWTGEPYSDLGEWPPAVLERARLAELRDHALETCVALEIEADPAACIAELEAMVVDKPLRERRWLLLMAALHRDGRVADALRTYQRARLVFAEELGIDPGPELRALEEQILVEGVESDTAAVEGSGAAAALPSGVVTFLLTDVEGSTQLWDRDFAAMSGALRVHDALIDAAVRAAGGNVLKSHGEGDSTFSVFARPTEALNAAIAARRALDAQDWPDGCRLEVRFALHIGEVEERDGEYYGTAVNRAARLRALAVGGQILASQAVADVVRDHLADDVSLVELGEQHLRGLAHPERVWAAVDAARPVREAIGGACPYKGLLAFEPEDSEVFFGREEAVGLLLGRLLARRFVVVVGASGSGKSSVVRAGVVAALARGEVTGSEYWSSTICTPGEHPLDAVAAEVEAADATRRVVLVVDQMEELFTSCDDPAERERFVNAVLDIVEHGDGNALAACALRADFFGHCAAVPRLAAALSDATVLLGAMTDRELRRAIEAPAEVAGLRLETGLVDLMLRDLAHEPGSLPLLSHALLETWRRRSGRTLTLHGYNESGGVQGAIAKTAEAVWTDALTEHRRPVARRIFLRLTELGDGTEDTRRRVARSELVSGADAEDTAEVLGLLVDRRLVTADDSTVQVAHEALIREWPRLRGWLDQDREGLRAHRHLTHAAEDWVALGRETTELYRGPRLAATREWLARDNSVQLNELEAAFLGASDAREQSERAAQQRSARRLRRFFVATVLLLVVALVGGLVAITQRNRANQQRDRARAVGTSAQLDRALAEVPAVAARDRTLAVLLAAQVERLRPDAAARDALFSALTAEPRLRFTLWGTHGGYDKMASFGDGRRIVELGRDGGDVFDLVARRLVGSFAVPMDAWGVSVSPDRRLIAAGSSNGTVTFFDAATLHRVGAPLVVGAPVRDLRFSRTGARLAVAPGPLTAVPITPATTPRLWDVATRTPTSIAFAGHHTTVSALAQSPDGRLIAAGDGGHVVLHHADTGTVISDIDVGDSIGDLAFSPDGRRLAVSASSFAVVYDVSTPTAPTALSGHLGIGGWVGFESDNDYVVVAHAPHGSVSVFDGSKPGFPRVGGDIETQHGSAPVSFVPGVGLVLSGWERSISVWDPTGRPVIAHVLQGVPSSGGFLSNDGTRLVVGSHRDTVSLYRWPDVHLVARLSISGPSEPTQFFTAANITRDSRTLVIGDRFGNIALFDAHTGRPLGPSIPVDPSHAKINFLAISPDGRFAVTASLADTENGVFVVDLATRRSQNLNPTPQAPLVPAFRPDGTQLVAITSLAGAFIYPVSPQGIGRGQLVTSLGTRPFAAAYSPDGTLLAIGSEDGTLSFYDPTTLRLLGPPMPLAANDIVALIFSPHGRFLIAEDANANFHLVDVSGHAPIGQPLAGSAPEPLTYGAASFGPDDRTMVLASPQGTTIWDLDPSHWTRDACTLAGRNLTPDEWHHYFSAVGPYQTTCTAP